MDPKHRARVAFHLTGNRLEEGPEPLDRLDLRPALFARYKDLSRLRYDFPLVLAADGVHSLSRMVDALLGEIAPPGVDGDRMRKHVLQLEREVRTEVSRGATGSLGSLWDACSEALENSAAAEAREAREALKVDGPVVDCDGELPRRLVTHLWTLGLQARAAREVEALDRLAVKLSDILDADFARSQEGCTAERLRSSFGRAHQAAFDFEAMARLLTPVAAGHALSESRKERVRGVLRTLRSHRSLLVPGAHKLSFDSCEAALHALRGRLPAMIDLVKAVAVAELEVEGRYVEALHDPFFEAFGERSLGPADLARFPASLVCLDAGRMPPGEGDLLVEVLSSDLPVKVVVWSDDLLAPSPLGDGSLVPGARTARLASLALGLGDAFVLQCSASHLYQARSFVSAGLGFDGPALFSVFAPASGAPSDQPPYLLAAAAMQSRAFPAFVYDPSAGPDLATRFALLDNPRSEADWMVVEDFSYQDDDHQRTVMPLAFTSVDFVAADRRYSAHFARVERSDWSDSLVPVADWLASPPGEVVDRVPYVWMVDEDDRLHRAVVSDAVIQASLRGLKAWRMLQELGGIHSSLADRAVSQERQAWESRYEALKAAAMTAETMAAGPVVESSVPVAAPATNGSSSGVAAVAPVAEARDPDEPFILTARCSSCNECININNRMFQYDGNKQAFIADKHAGTYRQMVEAAESCQVSVIHPGKPWNPDEPGLEELIARAQVFM